MKKNYKNTLLIDDDKFTNIYNRKVLSKHKAFGNISAVTSGKSALIYLRSVLEQEANRPDIIFLDINMPSMNGWEFLSEYLKLDQSLTHKIDLVVLTSSTYKDELKKSTKTSLVSKIIQKPLSKTTLDVLVNANIKSQKLSQ